MGRDSIMVKNGFKIYLVIGGWVNSKTDGDRHYINAKRLVELYGVDIKDCILRESDRQPYPRADELRIGYTRLEPSYNGDYGL
jgi:hypothetical protein